VASALALASTAEPARAAAGAAGAEAPGPGGSGLVTPPSFVPAGPAPGAHGAGESDGPSSTEDFLRGAPSLSGASGLLHGSTAAIGRAGELRLGLRGQYFSATNFLGPADHDRRLVHDLVWSLRVTPTFELFGDLGGASNRNERTRGATDVDPEVIRAGGRLAVGAKLIEAVGHRLALGLEAAIRLSTGPSDLLIAFGETSWWLGPMVSYDGVGLGPVPFRVHFAINYLADHSRDLGAFAMDSLAARQAVRFAYGMSPGRFRSTLALEVPLLGGDGPRRGTGGPDAVPGVRDWRATRAAPVVAFLEYSLDRLVGGADASFKEYDAPACGTMCSNARVQTTWTLGVRALVHGALAAELGLDLRDRSASLRYGPPQPPYNLIFGLLYPFEVEAWLHPTSTSTAASAAAERARAEAGLPGGAPAQWGGSTGAAGASPPGAGGSEPGGSVGRGTEAPLAPGQAEVVAGARAVSSAPVGSGSTGVAAGTPSGPSSPASAAAPATGAASPGAAASNGPRELAGAAPPSPPLLPPPDGRALQALRLEGRGQVRGRVTDPTGRGLQAALVMRGPRQSTQTASDGQGVFTLQLLPGRYHLRVQSPGFELQEMDLEITIGGDTRLDVRLQPPASDPSVQIQGREIRLARPIRFVEGRVELTADAQLLLKSVAEVLGVHPEISLLRIVAHTDGEPTVEADELTVRQAEAVRAFLVGRGVAEARLTVRGAGAREPLMPSTTPLNRARNRRVEFQLAP
jgi:outer membrane protein OmpA-like peptidoglycan-associated protein